MNDHITHTNNGQPNIAVKLYSNNAVIYTDFNLTVNSNVGGKSATLTRRNRYTHMEKVNKRKTINLKCEKYE